MTEMKIETLVHSTDYFIDRVIITAFLDIPTLQLMREGSAKGLVVEIRRPTEPPKPLYAEGDLVIDAEGYVFQKAPDDGDWSTSGDGFVLLHGPNNPAFHGSGAWYLDDMAFPLTHIPKERLL